MTRKEIENIIQKYNLKDNCDGNIKIMASRKLTADEINLIKACKAEILGYFADIKAAEEDRRKKIAAIEGLDELVAARNAEEEYHNEINRRMENEALSSFAPARPTVSSKELVAKYPRAAAYIKAEAWTYASHYVKAAAGKKALERIINGEDHEQVLADMEAEWSAAAHEAAMWN